MKVAVILPIYKQIKNLDRILLSIEHQTVKPDCVYLMFDRPEEDNEFKDKNIEYSFIEKKLYEYVNKHKALDIKINIISNLNTEHKLTGFCAGYIRNVGLSIALSDNIMFDIYVFCDGDCIMQNNCIKGHVDACSINIPVLSVGRRLESQYRWNDKREMDSSTVHLNLFNKNGCLINNPVLLEKCLIVWSCNIALNKRAINLIRNFNLRYYNKDEIFNSAFNGKWGGEDGFLGITAWFCRIFITMVGMLKSGVQHINHDRPLDKYSMEHKSLFDHQCELLKKKVIINPLPLSFFNT